MERVYERIYSGDSSDCFSGAGSWAVIHACRHPCFRRAIRRHGMSEQPPAYLEDGPNLYLDIFDGPARYFSIAPFEAFLSFASRHWQKDCGILIHCNQGISRAPSLAMLLLAKHAKVLPSATFDEAMTAFSKRIPDCSPGEGIRSFLREHWTQLLDSPVDAC